MTTPAAHESDVDKLLHFTHHKTLGGKAVDTFIWKAEGCYNTAATHNTVLALKPD